MFRPVLAFCAAVLLLGQALAADLTVQPAEVNLSDSFARQQLLVSIGETDATTRATFASSAENVVKVLDHGYLVPVADGSATIKITLDGVIKEVPVKVSGFAQPRPVDFRNEIEPLMSRYGCNAGGCGRSSVRR